MENNHKQILAENANFSSVCQANTKIYQQQEVDAQKRKSTSISLDLPVLQSLSLGSVRTTRQPVAMDAATAATLSRVLRGVATLTATILMIVSHPSSDHRRHAPRLADFPSYVFFILVNAAATLQTLVTICLSHQEWYARAITFSERIVAVLLCFALGVSVDTMYISINGNSISGCPRICTQYAVFCNRGIAAIFFSIFGTLIHLALMVFFAH